MELTDNLKGNLTSVITWIIITLAGACGVSSIIPTELSAIVGAIIGLAFALYNSKHPNNYKFLGNDGADSDDSC